MPDAFGQSQFRASLFTRRIMSSANLSFYEWINRPLIVAFTARDRKRRQRAFVVDSDHKSVAPTQTAVSYDASE